MNCKPGDLAVVVRSNFGNCGKLVRVIGPSPLNGKPLGTKAEIAGGKFQVKSYPSAFSWVIEALGQPLVKESGKSYQICPAGDHHLRPIRDQDGQDETLTWAGKPEGVSA